MNKKLKQQLKLTYTAPPPKRKEAFFKQIKSQIQTKQGSSISFLFLKYQKWVWATVVMGLIVVCLYPKSSTTEYPSTTSCCQEHIWFCVEEFSIVNAKKYVHSQCINCMKVCVTIEDMTIYDESVYVSNEDSSWQYGR